MPVPRIVSSLHSFHKGELFHLSDSTHTKLCFPVPPKKEPVSLLWQQWTALQKRAADLEPRGAIFPSWRRPRKSQSSPWNQHLPVMTWDGRLSASHRQLTPSCARESTDKFKRKPSKRLISAAGNQWRRHSKQVTVSSSGFDKSGEAHCCGNRFADEEAVFETCWTSDSRGN